MCVQQWDCWVRSSFHVWCFEDPSCFSPQWLRWCIVPQIWHKGVAFPRFSPKVVNFHIFVSSKFLLEWGEVSLQSGFVCPWCLVMLSIFSHTCWPFVCLLLKSVCSGILPISVAWDPSDSQTLAPSNVELFYTLTHSIVCSHSWLLLLWSNVLWFNEITFVCFCFHFLYF